MAPEPVVDADPTAGPLGHRTLQMRVRRQDDAVAVLEVSGEIDAFNASAMHAHIQTLVTYSGCTVLDLRGVRFLASTGVGVLIAGHEQAVAAGRRLLIVGGTNRVVLRPIQLCGMDGVLRLVPTLDEALATPTPGAAADHQRSVGSTTIR